MGGGLLPLRHFSQTEEANYIIQNEILNGDCQYNALLEAVHQQNLIKVKSILIWRKLRNKTQPPRTNNQNMTPLMIACFHYNERMIRLLLRYGANPNDQNDDLYTPLMILLRYDIFAENSSRITTQRIINLLLEAKANLRLQSITGETAYDYAILEEHPSEICDLINPDKNFSRVKSAAKKN